MSIKLSDGFDSKRSTVIWKKRKEALNQSYNPKWGFPKMVVPNNHGFSHKNDNFGVFGGYHHLRKHPNEQHLFPANKKNISSRKKTSRDIEIFMHPCFLGVFLVKVHTFSNGKISNPPLTTRCPWCPGPALKSAMLLRSSGTVSWRNKAHGHFEARLSSIAWGFSNGQQHKIAFFYPFGCFLKWWYPQIIHFTTRWAPKLSWTYGRYNLSCEVKLKLT